MRKRGEETRHETNGERVTRHETKGGGVARHATKGEEKRYETKGGGGLTRHETRGVVQVMRQVG